jgi:2-pyrone-4,6-dicarboxylate lactonase
MNMEICPLFERNTRTPHPLPPARSCDSQIHVFGDPAKYPAAASRTYDPPEGSFEDARAMHRALGIERVVVVQATIYGTDNSLLADCIRGQKNYRGVAIIDDSVSDKELLRLHEAGVRGARFNFANFLGLAPSQEVFERSIARIQELGWHARIHGSGEELLEREQWLRKLTLPAVIDHLAGIDVSRGLDQPACKLALDLLRGHNWWIMISNADRKSARSQPWEDVVPYAQAFAAAAPDRTIWGTDWPHVRYKKKMPNDADLLEFLYRCIPNIAWRNNILVDNPARLMGFDS